MRILLSHPLKHFCMSKAQNWPATVQILVDGVCLDEGCEFIGFDGVIDRRAVHDLVSDSIQRVSIVQTMDEKRSYTSVDPGNCPS